VRVWESHGFAEIGGHWPLMRAVVTTGARGTHQTGKHAGLLAPLKYSGLGCSFSSNSSSFFFLPFSSLFFLKQQRREKHYHTFLIPNQVSWGQQTVKTNNATRSSTARAVPGPSSGLERPGTHSDGHSPCRYCAKMQPRQQVINLSAHRVLYILPSHHVLDQNTNLLVASCCTGLSTRLQFAV
jgi:hypothetical protein